MRRSLRLVGYAIVCIAFVVALSGCDWAMTRFGSDQTGFNPFEGAIGATNVASLRVAWSATLPSGEAHGLVVANGTLFVGTDSSAAPLYAFDAAGKTGCSGTPTSCVPLWTSTVAINGMPSTANGLVYVSTAVGIDVFDATGSNGCGGVPKQCAPLWSYPELAGGVLGQPVISGGVLYAGTSTGNVYAFDATGQNQCNMSTHACSPLWVGPTSGGMTSTPAVANGVVYVSAAAAPVAPGSLNAFAADGCNAMTACAALWRAPGQFGPPSVSNGRVYAVNDTQPLSVDAFDAAGSTNCAGTPTPTETCSPLWSDVVGQSNIDPFLAIANGTVFADTGKSLEAFDATGNTNCSGTPVACTPVWTGALMGEAAPVVANGVAYAPESQNQSVAFDATGNTNCTGPPTTCTPIATVNISGFPSPIIINGTIYGTRNSQTIEALTP